MTKPKPRGRPKVEINLTDEERTELERLVRRARTNRNLSMRSKLILASASGMGDTAVAQKHHVNPKTVATWRKRFAEQHLEGLYDEPRPGAPRKITDEAIEELVVQTLETTPKRRTHRPKAETPRALERAQPILPMDLGMPERQTHNYFRHGTLDLFAALHVATGEVIARMTSRHRAKEFVGFLRDAIRNQSS